MNDNKNISFAPLLYIKSGVQDISFYEKAFDAVEVYRRTNGDKSIHVAELSIHGALFHLHEESTRKRLLSPEANNSSTVVIGLFVPDVDVVMNKALAAGAELINPATDYDYGYRQGELKDPFGHYWTIQKKI